MNVTGRRRSRAVAVLLAGIFAAGAAGAADLGRLLPGLEQESLLQRFERRDARPAPNMLVVAVDDKTFADLQQQWPFPRTRHAQAIDRLRRAGARVIVYDVQFTEQTTARADNALIDAIDRAHNVVLATAETDEHGGTNVLGGAEALQEHRRAGGREQPARGPRRRPAARRVRARRPGDARHRRGAPGRAPAQPVVVPRRRRLDRLPRAAGHHRHRLVLRPHQGPRRSRARARPRRRRRRGLAHAAGRASHADQRPADVGARDRGQRDRHRHPRQPAAPDADAGSACSSCWRSGSCRRWSACACARSWRPCGDARDRLRLPAHRPARVRARADPARRHAALRARAGHRDHDLRRLRRRAPPAPPRLTAQRRARGGRAASGPSSCARPSSRSSTAWPRRPSRATRRRACTWSASAACASASGSSWG